MPSNSELAAIFNTIADILDIQGANVFRVRAYRNAARVVEQLSEPIGELVVRDPKALDRLPGIGKGLHEKIVEYCQRGTITEYEELKGSLPAGLLELLNIPSLGPKRVKLLYETLGITTVEALEAAALAGQLRGLPGMGEKSEAKILKSIREYRSLHTGRVQWAVAEAVLTPYLAHLRGVGGIRELEPAGSYRRGRETVGDLDVLATTRGSPADVIAAFTEYKEVKDVLAQGDTKASVVLQGGLQVDLRVVPPGSFGAALQYFTGSKEHNVALRSRAKEYGLKLSEYGVFREEKMVAGRTEEEVYAALELPWIPPELRENRGEIEAAAMRALPRLVERGDIQGDMHVHTTASDGALDIRGMVKVARARGYRYLAITDHSKAVAIAHGLDEQRLRAQIKEIRAIRRELIDFDLFAGIEVDVLRDGSLDLSDEVLGELDFVVASLHFSTELSEAEMTRRMIAAIEHPFVDCIAHPTGRLIGERLPYAVDMNAVIEAARAYHKALEINASPHRLDLNEQHADMARRAGVPVCINTDAHCELELDNIRFGLTVARRAWCTPDDVLNTWSAAKIREWRARRRR
ncbi:MAG: DNA polymerase/3'-5' exonuclease PolX [bacterium]|nr:DNA polymerase/3'-5' exonuclease PolX [bacterium]